MFADHGMTDVIVNRRMFPKQLLPYQLDIALAACEEISYNALDSLEGQGVKARGLIQSVFNDRQNTAFNVARLTIVGRKREAYALSGGTTLAV